MSDSTRLPSPARESSLDQDPLILSTVADYLPRIQQDVSRMKMAAAASKEAPFREHLCVDISTQFFIRNNLVADFQILLGEERWLRNKDFPYIILSLEEAEKLGIIRLAQAPVSLKVTGKSPRHAAEQAA